MRTIDGSSISIGDPKYHSISGMVINSYLHIHHYGAYIYMLNFMPTFSLGFYYMPTFYFSAYTIQDKDGSVACDSTAVSPLVE